MTFDGAYHSFQNVGEGLESPFAVGRNYLRDLVLLWIGVTQVVCGFFLAFVALA